MAVFDNEFFANILLLVATGLATVAFFFIRSYLAQLCQQMANMRADYSEKNHEIVKRFDQALEKLDCRISSIEINLAVKSNTLDHCVREMAELKEKLKDL